MDHNKRIFAQSSSSTSAYARHLQQADAYVRYYGGIRPAPGSFRTEREILEEKHRFIRDREDDESMDREKRLAKTYYDNLFREYALVDLSRWREKMVALRWRTKEEVLSGKGQFVCAGLACQRGEQVEAHALEEALETFELNFAYVEAGVKKNALVKVRLCRKCKKKMREAQRRDQGDRRKNRSHNGRRDSRSRSPERQAQRDSSHRHRHRRRHRSHSRSRSPDRENE